MMEVAVKNPEVSIQRSLIGRKLGRYEILAKIASGGMAAVYVARARGVAGFERLTAIKLLHANLAHEEEFVKMFLDEARLAARIRHPNVVATLDISDTVDAGYYLVMEYIEGDHLGKLLSGTTKAEVRMDLPVVLRIITDVLNGLNAAHNLTDENGKKLNLVHRDISPHNIMVGVDGIARLTDFGIAKAEDRLSHTRDGQIKGKLGYMAPEHASKGISDARSDLFSVGIILWECLTYKRLFRAATAAESLRKLLIEPIPPPSSVNEDFRSFDELLNRALSREPDERFQTADEFTEALEAAAAKYGGTASLRKVGKVVRKYAAARIEREKALIKESLQSIRTANDQNDRLSQSSDEPVSDASIRSASGSSSSSRSSPSTSEASLRSGVRPLSSESETVEDNLGSDSYIQSQASSLSSIAEPAGTISTRAKWFVVIAVVWCVVLAAIAFFTTRENKPEQLRVIEIPIVQEPAETTETEPPITVADPEKIDSTESLEEPKNQAAALKSESVGREQPSEDQSQASTTKGEQEGQGDKIESDVEESSQTDRKPMLQKESRSKSRSSSKRPRTVPRRTPKETSIDELPPFNPYLHKK